MDHGDRLYPSEHSITHEAGSNREPRPGEFNESTVKPFDLIVVGGGPAGLTAAIAARLSGLTVLILEPKRGTIDKACGEGLMPDTVANLARRVGEAVPLKASSTSTSNRRRARGRFPRSRLKSPDDLHNVDSSSVDR